MKQSLYFNSLKTYNAQKKISRIVIFIATICFENTTKFVAASNSI